MKYTQNCQFGKYAKRYNFSKSTNQVQLPNLIDIQLKPYREFIKHSIQNVFNELFPIIKPSDGKIILEIMDWTLEEPLISIQKCRSLMQTYTYKLYGNLKLTVNIFDELVDFVDTGDLTSDKSKMIHNFLESKVGLKLKLIEESKDYFIFVNMSLRSKKMKINVTVKKSTYEGHLIDIIIEIQERTFFCKIPKMTPKGTFIVNGHEKVIVLQIVRSPGAYFNWKYIPKKNYNKKFLEIIPSRGAWLKFESDQKKTIDGEEVGYFCINKSKKITISNLLTIFGVTPEEALKLFDNNLILANSYKKDYLVNNFATDRQHATMKIYQKIKLGEVTSEENALRFISSLFFDLKKYDLSLAGRYKLMTSNILNDAFRQIIAHDILDEKGAVFLRKNTFLVGERFDKLKVALEKGYCRVKINLEKNDFDEEFLIVNKIRIYKDRFNLDKKQTTPIIGLPFGNKTKYRRTLAINDLITAINTFLHLGKTGINRQDDIDALSNKILKTNRILLEEQFRNGNLRNEKFIKEKMTSKNPFDIAPSNLFTSKPLDSLINEFFNISPLCQFLAQTNPLSELSNKRRISSLGPGGLKSERASMEARDVHFSQFSLICPVESPEGQKIGLINNLSLYAQINEFNFLESPHLKVVNGKVTNEIVYISPHEAFKYYVAPPDVDLDQKKRIIPTSLAARHHGENVVAVRDNIDFIGVSPKQILSAASSLIPLAENNDVKRNLMAAAMSRQAVPLLESESPTVGTGMEYYAARDSGFGVLAEETGTVTYVDGKKIIIKNQDNKERVYLLDNFLKGNQSTAITQTALVYKGDQVKKGDFIADGPAMENGELALGKNCLVAFTTYDGYNFEDAVVISQRLVNEDIFTSLHIISYDIEVRETELGNEEVTASIPNVAEKDLRHLDDEGIIRVGTEVEGGDILVGKIAPKTQTYLSPTDKLLNAIFGDKSKKMRDVSLRVPNGVNGTVQKIVRFKNNDSDLAADVIEKIKVYIAAKRKIQVGDKMAGRHGNKGVVSIVLPNEDMPHLEDGTQVDVLLNPLGVPSRMNIGQVLEIHMGQAAQNLNIKVSCPVFESPSQSEFDRFMEVAKVPTAGKYTLIDGRTGQKMAYKVGIGIMYLMKLDHMVLDKVHARSTGSYSLVTQQPLSGKAQKGGQRLGEMERWAFETYGSAWMLRESFTYRSDDLEGRSSIYGNIVHNSKLKKPGLPESFKVMIFELRALGFNLQLLDENQNEIKLSFHDSLPKFQPKFMKSERPTYRVQPKASHDEVSGGALAEETINLEAVKDSFAGAKNNLEEDIIATSNSADFEIEKMFDQHFTVVEEELNDLDSMTEETKPELTKIDRTMTNKSAKKCTKK